MARYIDADAFLANEIKRCGCIPIIGSCPEDIESLAYQLAKAPTADVVEVVRCKDCKYHHWKQEPEHGKTIHLCSVLNAEVFKDFYCYHGTPEERGGEK